MRRVLDQCAGIFNNPVMTTLAQFNNLQAAAARALILRCCASTRWAECMVAARPYHSIAQFTEAADSHWRAMGRRDVLEAFRGHPQIGRPDSLKNADPGDHALAAQEQSAAARASAPVSASLIKHNRDYEKKFGFIFIVCASGKSAEHILRLLRARMDNTHQQEFANAAEEQRKITQLRIHKLFTSP